MSFRVSSTEESRLRDVLRGLLDDVSTLKRLSATTQPAQTQFPSGAIVAFGGAAAPSGWVLCDGSTYDGTLAAYTDLWTALGVTYGGTGQAAFKVPDLQGRVAVMKGTNADVNALGSSDGLAVASRSPKHNHTNGVTASHNLTLPNHVHSHTLTLPDHAHSDTISFSDSGHSHGVTDSGHTHVLEVGGDVSDPAGRAQGFANYGYNAPGLDSATTGISINSGTASLSKSGAVTGVTSTPAINGAIGNPTTNPAISGSVTIGGTVGPGGSRPTDGPGFLVVNHIVKL